MSKQRPSGPPPRYVPTTLQSKMSSGCSHGLRPEGSGQCEECAILASSWAWWRGELEDAEECEIQDEDDDTVMSNDLLTARAEGAREALIQRNKLSVENSRLRIKIHALETENAHLKEILSLAEPAVGREHAVYPHIVRALKDDSTLAGAGIKGAGGRNIQACTRCRARKQVCDGDGKTPCGRCLKAEVECEYADPAKRGPKTAKL